MSGASCGSIETIEIGVPRRFWYLNFVVSQVSKARPQPLWIELFLGILAFYAALLG